jgi:hypothetical protein
MEKGKLVSINSSFASAKIKYQLGKSGDPFHVDFTIKGNLIHPKLTIIKFSHHTTKTYSKYALY